MLANWYKARSSITDETTDSFVQLFHNDLERKEYGKERDYFNLKYCNQCKTNWCVYAVLLFLSVDD